MSSENANGAVPKDAVPKDDKGEGKVKDDTIAKVAGAVIATGVAFSLYRSFFGGKKEEKEKVCVEKPEGLSEFQAEAKSKYGEMKEAVDQKGKNIRASFEAGRESAAEEESKAESSGFGWFKKSGAAASKKKDEVAAEVEKSTESAEKAIEADKKAADDSKKSAEESASSFVNKLGDEAKTDKAKADKAIATAEKNVESAGSSLIDKTGDLFKKLFSGGNSKAAESKGAWSKAEGGSNSKDGGEHSIGSGDTLYSIAQKYGVHIEKLKTANGIWNADYIVAGDTLTIPK